jgi:hypothetical protein
MNDTTPLDTTPLDTTPDPTPRRRFSARPLLIGTAAGVVVLGLGVGGFAVADSLDDASDDRIVITSSPNATGSPRPTDDSTPSPNPSSSDDSDDNDVAVGSATYEQVTAAALAAVGGGTVTEVDRGDSPGDAAWKVEIRLANGNEAEVRLDADLTVLRVELDNDSSGTSGSGSDDSNDDNDDDDNGSGGHGSDD